MINSYTSKFCIGSQVYIDGQKDLMGRITEVAFRHDGETIYVVYTVDWLHNGQSYTAYMSALRLTAVNH